MSRGDNNNNFMPTRALPPPSPSPGSSNNFIPTRRLSPRRPPPPPSPPRLFLMYPNPFQVSLSQQNGGGDFQDPWIPIEFPREMPRIDTNPWPRQAVPEFPAAQEAESRLTKEEQNKALKKLRK